MYITRHAAERMVQRHISADEVRDALDFGSIWTGYDGKQHVRWGDLAAILVEGELITTFRIGLWD